MLFLVGAATFYSLQEQQLKRKVEADLLSIATLKVNQIVDWRTERLADASVVSESPHFTEAVAGWLEKPQPVTREMLLDAFRSRARNYHYDDVTLVDSAGVSLLSLSGQQSKFGSSTLLALSATFQTKRPSIAELEIECTGNEPHIDIITPIFSVKDTLHRPIGAIIFTTNARQFLYPLIQSWPVPSRSAETILVRRDGDSVVFLNDMRFRKDAALKTRISLTQSNVPAVMAVTGKHGVFRGVDYRGVPVYSAVMQVPNSPWAIVAKVDEREAMASWQIQSLLILVVFLFAIGGIVTIGLLFWQRDEKAHYRTLYTSAAALQESEMRYSTTLMSIGDGVIAADSTGVIELLNPVAEQLTGWTQTEARGKRVEEVFCIVNEETRRVVDNPLERVMREGIIVGLANHTVLISRDGVERPIADSGAPIRNAKGEIVGAVLIFRDVTQSHRHQQERETTIRLLQLINDPAQTHDLIRNILVLIQEWFKFDAVGLRMRSGEDYPYYEYQGFSQEFIRSEDKLCAIDESGHIERDNSGNPVFECTCGQVISGRIDPSNPNFTPKGSFWINHASDISSSDSIKTAPYHNRNRCVGEGFESIGLFPLRVGEYTIGLLQLNDRTPGRFSAESLAFMESIADQIAIALRMRETQEALYDSEEKFRHLVESLRNEYFFYRHDLKRVFTYLSPSVTDVLGYSVEEFMTDSSKYVTDNPLNKKVDEFTTQSLLGNPQPTYELELYHKNGEIRLIAVTETPVFAHSGKVIGVEGIAHDITELKRSEKALQLSHERLKEAQQTARLGNWEANLITGELFWSDVIFDIFGFDLKSFVPSVSAFRNAVHPEDRELVVESERRSEQSGLHDVVHRIIRPDNEVRFVHELARRFNDDKGNPVMLRGTVQDVTELKRAEDEIRASEERFRGLFENATVGLYHTTIDGQIILANRAFLNLVECSSMEELFNRKVENRGYLNPADAEEFLRRMGEDGVVSGFETAWKRSDGSPVYVRESARLVRDEEGGMLFFEGIVEDISKHKKAEEENQKLQHQLLHAQKMEAVGRLAGGVAHDFNNMLLAILGNAELALSELIPEHPVREYLTEIEKAGQRSTDLTRQLLAFARRQTISPVAVDLNDAVSGMLKMLRRLIGEDLSLFWKPGIDLWNVKIDPSQIDQILANLTVNARDAISGVGKITIETMNVVFNRSDKAAHPDAESGEYVLLAVSDDGCGIDAKTKEHLFEPFYTTKALGKGTGMGLATVFGIVKQNRGFIYVYSEVNQGTTFKIYLPRCDSHPTESVEDEESVELMNGYETILLVEDEPSILALGQKMLDKQGYKVLAATGPEEAIAIACEHSGKIDLLLTDVIMPGMNGEVLASRLTALRPELKCLYMSGYTANAIAHHDILDEGINFLQKPFTAKSLGDKVKATLLG